MTRSVAVAAVFLAAFNSMAQADFVYRPVNPTFGGSPLNSSHLQSLAAIQNLHEESTPERTSSQQFLRMLEARLYSSLSTQVSEAIFGEDALPSGTIAFSDQKVDFVNTGTEIQLTVTDLANGQVTTIVIPTVQ